VSAKVLYDQFPETDESETFKRANNIPKFLFNLTMNILMVEGGVVNSGRHHRWITSMTKRFLLNRQTTRSRYALMELLCDDRTEAE
jgi:hypothetical protein